MKGKRTATALVSLSLCVALLAPVGAAWAYFTSYATTRGSLPITLGTQTEITEDFNNWTKSVSITNSADSSPVFIRVKAFSGSTYELLYSGDDLWTPGADGFYYYANPVNPGESTSVLQILIDKIPPLAAEGNEFNVVVVYESTLALYNANGEAYANWDNILDTGNVSGGGAQ